MKQNNDYLTPEKTIQFLAEHESVCQTMDVKDFTDLFKFYDLSFIDDYSEVMDTIATTMAEWKSEAGGTKLIKVTTFDSNCIFCSIGKKVKVYKWTFCHTKETGFSRNLVHHRQIAFMFDIQEGCLVNYGTCNAYLSKEELRPLKE